LLPPFALAGKPVIEYVTFSLTSDPIPHVAHWLPPFFLLVGNRGLSSSGNNSDRKKFAFLSSGGRKRFFFPPSSFFLMRDVGSFCVFHGTAAIYPEFYKAGWSSFPPSSGKKWLYTFPSFLLYAEGRT